MMFNVCNSCDKTASETDKNPMGYCHACLVSMFDSNGIKIEVDSGDTKTIVTIGEIIEAHGGLDRAPDDILEALHELARGATILHFGGGAAAEFVWTIAEYGKAAPREACEVWL